MNSLRIQLPRTYWEIIDVEMGHTFIAYTPEGRDDFEAAVQLMKHHAIVKEVKP